MKYVVIGFTVLYLVALFLFLIGTLGWLGQDRDPLFDVFLLPLGLPRNLLGDRLGLEGPAVLLLAPLLDAAILLWLWRRLCRFPRRGSGQARRPGDGVRTRRSLDQVEGSSA